MELAAGMELAVHIFHVPAASLQFSTSNQQPALLICVVRSKRITGEDFTKCDPRCLGHGGCSSHTRNDTSHAQVRYLGHQPRVQQDVPGRQIAVDDGPGLLVEVVEAAGHVVQYRALQTYREER